MANLLPITVKGFCHIFFKFANAQQWKNASDQKCCHGDLQQHQTHRGGNYICVKKKKKCGYFLQNLFGSDNLIENNGCQRKSFAVFTPYAYSPIWTSPHKQGYMPERVCVHSPLMSHTKGRWGGYQAKKQAYGEEFLQQCGKNAVHTIQKQKTSVICPALSRQLSTGPLVPSYLNAISILFSLSQ